ncbi:MAG TPA: hypothetical protein VGS22_26280 [Thermoanaerobaculia bacterium]|jgi:hypothetical protein|nr:hypothetical protein [Thermoanaerobaculia bacterium]
MSKQFHPVRLASVFALIVGVALGVPFALQAQALPTPKDFVANLDVRCYQLNDQPALNVPLQLDHLNPYFVEKGLPSEDVILGKPQDLCVPVFKNQIPPPPSVLPFMRFVDWKCYEIKGPSLDLELHLDHLNPEIPPLLGPSVDGVVREPQQLCVPVRKNNQVIPTAVLSLVQWLDVKCYRFEPREPVKEESIFLNHLNPLYAGIPGQKAIFQKVPDPQLCVPVMKNRQAPPDSVAKIIAYSDVLCYPAKGAAINQPVTLNHLNPVLRAMHLPAENVVVGGTTKLCVPVAKNGFFPPG